MEPEFSIVIPTFRRPSQLREALKSVVAQGDFSLEVFVVDDSPEGSAAEAVQAFGDPRLHYIKNPSPSGGIPSKVRNFGLKRCRGKFVHFLDDDDIVPAGYYQRARQEFEASPGVAVVFGRVEPFGDGPPDQLARETEFFRHAWRRARLCGRLRWSWLFVGQMLFGQVLLVCGSAVLRRECVEAVGGFDPNVVLHEDRDFLVRAMRRCGVRFIDCLSLKYRIGFPSLMHAADPSEQQLIHERNGAKLLREKYYRTHGPVEYYALKIVAKLLDKAAKKVGGRRYAHIA